MMKKQVKTGNLRLHINAGINYLYWKNYRFHISKYRNNCQDWMTKTEIGMGKIMQPFRLSLVEHTKGPHLFDIVSNW
jgi:hypothetical protein